MKQIKWVFVFLAVLLASCSTVSTVSKSLPIQQTENKTAKIAVEDKAVAAPAESETRKMVVYVMTTDNRVLYKQDNFWGGNILGVIVFVEEDYSAEER